MQSEEQIRARITELQGDVQAYYDALPNHKSYPAVEEAKKKAAELIIPELKRVLGERT